MSEIENFHEYNENSEETVSTTEKKLGDLLMRGWVMLAKSCPIESKENLTKNIF